MDQVTDLRQEASKWGAPMRNRLNRAADEIERLRDAANLLRTYAPVAFEKWRSKMDPSD